MENKLLDDGRVEEVLTYPTTRSSLIILDEQDKKMRPFYHQKWDNHYWKHAKQKYQRESYD